MKKSLSYYKKKLWKMVSEFVRRLWADRNGNCRCVTCKVLRHWKEMQAGHFIDGRNNAVLWDLRGIHPQCMSCNIFKHGNKVEYFRFMQEEYGDEIIEELRSNSKKAVKITIPEYIEMIKTYTKKLQELG